MIQKMKRRRRPRMKADLVDLKKTVWGVVRRHVTRDTYRLVRLREGWHLWFPRRIAEHTWPAALYGSCLRLHVANNQWLHELHYLRDFILEKIASEYPGAKVTKLELYLGDTDPQKLRIQGGRSAEGNEPSFERKRIAPLSENPPPETIQALHGVQDPELRDALAAARLLFGKAPQDKKS